MNPRVKDTPRRVPVEGENARMQDEFHAWAREIAVALREIAADVERVRGEIPTVPKFPEDVAERLDTIEVLLANTPTSKVKTPVFTPSDSTGLGSADFPLNVAIASTAGATIRWSKTGIPADALDGNEYTGPVAVLHQETLHAKAFKAGFIDSAAAIQQYLSNTFTPAFAAAFA